MNNKLKSVFFILLCFGFGLSAVYFHNNEARIGRNPAALQSKVFQISTLSSEEIKTQLTNKLRVMPTTDGFKTITLSGFSANICKDFSEIEMVFKAEGVAVAGEAPTLKINSPCKAGQDPSEMASVILPVSQILKEKYRNAEFKFSGYDVKLTTSFSADSWPKTWILQTFKFINPTGVHKTSVMNSSLNQNKTDLIVLEL